MQCHVQEITTTVAADPTGTYLVGGTKSGRIYWWDICSGELLASFQGHFKSVTATQFTRCGLFVVTASLDGMVRVWDVIDIVSTAAAASAGSSDGWAGSGRARGALNVTPFRFLMMMFVFCCMLITFPLVSLFIQILDPSHTSNHWTAFGRQW